MMDNLCAEIKKKTKRLEDISWETSKARFNASDRLKKKQKVLVFSIIIFTVIQIGISVLLISVTSSDNIITKVVATISIALSVFIALISNTESITKDALNSHLLHKCGVDLKSLNKKISILQPKTTEELLSLSEAYDKIISECNLNHEAVDFKMVLNDMEGISRFDKFLNCIQYLFSIYCTFLVYLVSAFVFGLIFFLIYRQYP